ncbi:hypothetical protein M0802_009736 [Mischocyttarus mexicanus]|nr:hypothetical protein M0802_009736 [Mischocyttarus mexicanus]
MNVEMEMREKTGKRKENSIEQATLEIKDVNQGKFHRYKFHDTNLCLDPSVRHKAEEEEEEGESSHHNYEAFCLPIKLMLNKVTAGVRKEGLQIIVIETSLKHFILHNRHLESNEPATNTLDDFIIHLVEYSKTLTNAHSANYPARQEVSNYQLSATEGSNWTSQRTATIKFGYEADIGHDRSSSRDDDDDYDDDNDNDRTIDVNVDVDERDVCYSNPIYESNFNSISLIPASCKYIYLTSCSIQFCLFSYLNRQRDKERKREGDRKCNLPTNQNAVAKSYSLTSRVQVAISSWKIVRTRLTASSSMAD